MAYTGSNFLRREFQASGVYPLEDLVNAAIILLRVILLEVSYVNCRFFDPATVRLVKLLEEFSVPRFGDLDKA
jgi:hypothetical protein